MRLSKFVCMAVLFFATAGVASSFPPELIPIVDPYIEAIYPAPNGVYQSGTPFTAPVTYGYLLPELQSPNFQVCYSNIVQIDRVDTVYVPFLDEHIVTYTTVYEWYNDFHGAWGNFSMILDLDIGVLPPGIYKVGNYVGAFPNGYDFSDLLEYWFMVQ